MENQSPKKAISEQVIDAVKAGQLKMRPKWHFILNAILWLTGTAIVLLALLYLSSLIVFVTRQTGIWAVPAFGWYGFFIFLTSIPWLLVLLVVIFTVILEILVRRYSFAYRWPLLYLGMVMLLVVAVSGLLIARTPLHGMISHCAPGFHPQPNLPPCGAGLYGDLDPKRPNPNNVFRGSIIEFLSNSNFSIEDRRDERILIIVTSRTRLPQGANFEVGDMVVVVGDRSGDRVEAFGIVKDDRW
jgi:hypothetical protein